MKQGLVEPGNEGWGVGLELAGHAGAKERLKFATMFRLPSIECSYETGCLPLPSKYDSSDAPTDSALDLLSRYLQVPLSKDEQERRLFCDERRPLTWTMPPVGLISVPAKFDRLMEQVWKEFQRKLLLFYLDDIIVYSTDFDCLGTRFEEVLH